MSAVRVRPTCAVPSCTNSVKCGGLCAAHYYERSAADNSRSALAAHQREVESG